MDCRSAGGTFMPATMTNAAQLKLYHSNVFRAVNAANAEDPMSVLWTIIIGFVAGVIAKLIYPGNKNEPSGFILTTLLGIVGAFVATYLGQAVGWYRVGEGAGFIGAIVGAIIVLAVWGAIAPRLQKS
jgi:uncharacterized membrane protein YeaQ/YmgE (transglycosylase-associated protein family)